MRTSRPALILIAVLALAVTTIPTANAEQTPWMHIEDESAGEGWGVLDLERLWDSGKWQEQHSLTGNWGGWRSQLYQDGFGLLGSYETETAGNPVGGDLHKVRFCDTLAIAGFMDLERIFGLRNTFLLVSMAQRMGHNLSEDIPNFFWVQQLYGGETIRLDHLVLETSFLEDRLDFVGGRVNALDDFAASSYFCYSQNIGICGSPYSLETNSALSNYPLASWGLRGRFQATEDFYSMTGVYNTYEHFGDNKYHGVDFSIRHNSGVAVLQEFAYRPLAKGQSGYPGFIKVGGFYDSEPRIAYDQGPRINSNWTIYEIAQRRLYRQQYGGLRQGLTGFATFTYSPPAKNTIQYFADAGLVYIGMSPRRPEDALGAFALFGEFSPDLREVQREMHNQVQTQETVLELNYRYQITHWSYIQPDLQYIIRPNGDGSVPNALVLAIQAGVTL